METIKKKYVVSELKVVMLCKNDIVRTSGTFGTGDALLNDLTNW